MPKQIIELTFEGDKVTIHTSGFTGTACQKATEALERDLGLTERKETKTAEFHKPLTAAVTQKR